MYVKIEEEIDLHSGLLHTGGKHSKTALINDVSWGYDRELPITFVLPRSS